MITLPKDLREDSGILQTAAQHNAVNASVFAAVLAQLVGWMSPTVWGAEYADPQD
jgi:hypothetical protein